ncbi:hypothetical protein F7725_005230 [Dissostichus mawsoni]|uniref:Proteasome subunit beta type-3 n=1 Tax=Dissostichus mawsoni TaxID=36200 RepID=A0A7J5YQZ8_DISMA|nr:hypothetical protein F7725_005230 [Dissostichus mawsoni]
MWETEEQSFTIAKKKWSLQVLATRNKPQHTHNVYMSYNGGAVMAMRGKNCVAIAADRRFGIQAQMVTTDFQKIFPMGDKLYIGLAGLATDVQTVFGPYYIEPVIAGIDPKTSEPFICSLDLIGCPMVTEDFVVSGTCSEQMYGMCESLWEPDMVSSV